MISFLKNNERLLLNILFWLAVFPFLFVSSFVNLENVYQFNLSDTYTLIYYVYLFISIILFFLLRFFNISNTILKDEVNYTIKLIFLLSVFTLPSFFINHFFIAEHLWESNLYLRSYWKIAFIYFALALLVSPVLKFIKREKIRDYLILSRKVFWILSFLFFVKHWLEYFAVEYIFQVQYHSDVSYLEYVTKNMIVRMDALSGFVAGLMMILLWITSNKVSVRFLSGKRWKFVQSLVYPAFLISVIHVAFSSRFDNFYVFLFVLVVFFRTLSYITIKNNSKENIGKTTTKYICIPCGYIYDENIWDPDWWLIPGTKFADIPDDWYCPVCGVWKADFEPYYENENTIFGWYLWEVISNTMLTDDVMELVLRLDTSLDVLKWQYSILTLKDFDWEFSRAYSIVEANKNVLTFWIKLNDTGRWWRALKNIKIWDIIKVKWVYWEFLLKQTTNQKVFIATGTGLSPIMNMLSEPLASKNNYLFFGAQTEKDLFYLDKLQNVDDLSVNIYISRENTEKYNNGRIDLSKFVFDKDAEFYICGNPWVVNSTKDYLKNAWYTNVFVEKY